MSIDRAFWTVCVCKCGIADVRILVCFGAVTNSSLSVILLLL